MKWYFKVLKKYAEFNGRASRKEFWLFTLFNFTMTFLLLFTSLVLNEQVILIIAILYSFAMIIPNIALSVRRLHDIGLNAWKLLIIIIPLFGIFWIIMLMATEPDRGYNQYGPDPRIIN